MIARAIRSRFFELPFGSVPGPGSREECLTPERPEMKKQITMCGAVAGLVLRGACQEADGRGGPGGLNPMVPLFRRHMAAAT